MITFFIICLLVQPWIFLPFPSVVDQFRLPQSTFMDFIFMGLIAFSINRGMGITYKNKYLSYLIGWVFFSFALYFFVPFGIHLKDSGRVINVWNMEPLIHFILGLFATICVLSTFEKEDYIRIAKALTISATLISIFAIMQYIRLDPLKSIAKYNCANVVSACLDNPNLVGNYLVLTLPLFFLFKNKLNWVLFSIVCIGCLVAKSDIVRVLLFLGIWTSLILHFRKIKWVRIALLLVLLLAVSFATYYLRNFSYIQYNEISSGRLLSYEIAFAGIQQNPLFGLGIGAWRQHIPYIVSTWWTVVHSDWLELWLGIGLLGIFLLVLTLVNSIKKVNMEDDVSRCYLGSLVVFLLMMLVSFPLETATIALPGLISWWAIET